MTVLQNLGSPTIANGAPAPVEPLDGVTAAALREAAETMRSGLKADTYALAFSAGATGLRPWVPFTPALPSAIHEVARSSEAFYAVLIAAQAAEAAA
jgi:hypothetical protein